MSKEIKERLQAAKKKIKGLEKHLDIARARSEAERLKNDSQSESFWLDPVKAQGIMKELNEFKALLEKWDRLEKNLEDVQTILDLMQEEESDDLTREAVDKLAQVESSVEELEFKQMLSGEHDKANAILFINAGAGGTESCDWAEMLLRMYRRWADAHGFRNEVIDFTPGDGAGFRSVVLTVDGDYAFGYLKAEIGVHRLVRISPFDAAKRRHTSFASVFVLADVEEDIQIEIRDEDLRVDTFRSGGAGGQHVNKTESAIRLTHLPSGIVVACQNGRSQHQNRATAMKLLKAKLYDAELAKRQKERDVVEKTKKKIEWGSQIRSYVMQPYRLVKDHRTNTERGDVDKVMDGDLDLFMQKFLMEFPA
ncbi:MAG: peptide chain release factor 2 [Deltaproteobacteria bacterium]|nr:peptide chain release factor 2 [Deltaproteobacteria bacterium]